MGLWRLQHVVHELGQRHARTPIEVRTNRRAYFSAAPGDQHSFGVVMVEDFFRHAGWQTASASTATFAGLAEIVAAEWFELIGLTVSYELHIESLAEIIAALRKVSKNPAVLVMVGGMIFAEQPGLAARVGADGTASDGKLAVLCAEKLLGDIVNPSNSASSRASR
jgi:methanogenic corrinoid protein MtbC1